MGKQDIPRVSSGKSARGLLERAAEIFDLGGALRGAALPPLDIPADMMPPARESARPPVRADVSSEGAPASHVRAADWRGEVQTLDRASLSESGLLVPGAAISGLAEEFRIVKRELISAMRGERGQDAVPNGNVILVTSAHPGDGKTWCAANLALSLAAEGDLEVLLVDADFAKPGIPALFGLSGETGLMDVLTNPALRVEDIVIRTDLANLAVLPAGQGSERDAEYLASTRTDDVIAALVSGRPDRVVIFDSPPLLAASAASVLASHVGQTLLVVRADSTTETALRDAADLLKGCRHIQLLLNGVKFSASGRRFGTYYGKQGE
ncbi:MAG: P-loop NTPase [Sphingobium sp.]